MTALKIAPGSGVCMHFSLALPDGSEAVSTFGEKPITFSMGDGTLSEGLELALYGLLPGSRQTLHMDGSTAFGARDESNIHAIPLDRFPAEMDPHPGLIVAFDTEDGTQQLPGAIVELRGKTAMVDFNHPLAGREIVFEVEIISVTPPAPSDPE